MGYFILNIKLTIFTDGACSGNPGPGGWAAVIFGPRKVFELGGSVANTTNNRMEMTAAVEALKYILSKQKKFSGHIDLFTDSKYLINGIMTWVHNWRRKAWKTAAGEDVVNQDLWKELLELSESIKVSWFYVPGHSDHPVNDRCDIIAVDFSKGREPLLFSGNKEDYFIQIEDVPIHFEKNISASQEGYKKSGQKGIKSYLSLVGGKLVRHADWNSCERRVKGRPNVRYKKANGPEDEIEIALSWGFSPEDIENEA